MSSPKPHQTSFKDKDTRQDLAALRSNEIAKTNQLPVQLDRLAQLVASGEVTLPEDLSADQMDRLVRKIRQCRRRRLVQYLARAIAVDIAAEHEQNRRD